MRIRRIKRCVCLIDGEVLVDDVLQAALDNRVMLDDMKKHYIVETHVGLFETWATSEKKAISNIRYRLGGTACTMNTTYWKAREV